MLCVSIWLMLRGSAQMNDTSVMVGAAYVGSILILALLSTLLA